MIKTESGRISKSQVWQIAAMALQSINVAVLVAFGVPAEYMALAVAGVQIASGYVSMKLRMVTTEPMR